MNDISFFSSNSYLYLPTKKNPKVALLIDNKELAKNSFNLYNPFSSNAKFLKRIMKFYFINLNLLCRNLFIIKKNKSKFIIYLEHEFKQPLLVSLYFATAKDKIVLQLQTSNAKIIGYLKYPLNETGLKNIKNEIRAIEILSDKKIIDSYILTQKYYKTPFLLLKELKGSIEIASGDDIELILNKFKRIESYSLSEHPRILELRKRLIEKNMQAYLLRLLSVSSKATKSYQLVYEHGDFTPWNLIKVEEKYIPFDFEYFVEDGLEYFDLIKYYYQIGKLLYSKKGTELITFVFNKVDVKESKILFELFLINEIVKNMEENLIFEFEENLMEILEII